MTDAHRVQLRSIMKRAWWKCREQPEVAFAEHLRASWAHHKELAAFYAKTAQTPRRLVHLRSPIDSPVEKALRGQPYARTEARDRSRLTTALGW